MGKYEALSQYLASLDKEEETLSFSGVERILGFCLPASAAIHRPWWANDEKHVQAVDGWLSAGWKVKSADLKTKKVTFIKFTKSKQEKATPQPEIHQKLPEGKSTPSDFESFARSRMSTFFKRELRPRRKEGWPKLFDMVSDDYRIVGDAKYLSMVRGERIPPAKFSVIAEHIWMLEKVDAKTSFLVFGNDKRVPDIWLKKYGEFVKSVKFYFLMDNGNIIPLN